jgi:hypothetical protein
MLKKGDKVVMHTCIEAEVYDGTIWTVASDEYELCGEKVVKLENFVGAFAVKYLQKVNIRELTHIEEIKVYNNGVALVKYLSGEMKVVPKVVHMNATLIGWEEK